MTNIDGRIIVTEDGKKYKKASALENIAAGATAFMAGGYAASIPINIGQSIVSTAFDTPDLNIPDDVFEKVINMPQLKKAGIKILDVSKDRKSGIVKKIAKPLTKFVKNSKLSSRIEEQFESVVDEVAKGENAFFDPVRKAIVFSKDKGKSLFFHEAGHALNSVKPLTKCLQKMSGASLLAFIPLAVALLKRKKVEGEKPKNALDATTTFIKDNCAALSFLSFTPMLAEEGLASIVGINLAKTSGLSKTEIASLAKKYGKGFASYAGLALGITAFTFVASKVKDALTRPREIKEQNS